MQQQGEAISMARKIAWNVVWMLIVYATYLTAVEFIKRS